MRKREKHWFRGFFRTGLICGLLAGSLMLGGCGAAGFHFPGNIGTIQTQNTQALSGDFKAIEEKLMMIQGVLDQYYLEDDEIDTDALAEGIYKGYVDALGEKYTYYYSAEEYDSLQQDMSGTYSGIGALLTQAVDTGVITIVRPFKGTPSEEAGLLKDDVLYKVEGEEVTGKDLTEVVSRIKGEEGTTVNLEIYRPSEDRYFTADVERRSIETPMVEYEMLEDQIGYVEIMEFMETTSDQFNRAVEDLTRQGMQGLIIDLRDNPGGIVDSATDVLDRILPADQLLVYTVDKNNTKEEYYSKDNDVIDVPIAVLINDDSASASEIVSGCLQDLKKAVLVGETSFGKGIVQYIIPLGDGSALKLTSAKYYTPDGRNIHGTGIDPDVEVKLDPDQEGDEQLDAAADLLRNQIGEKAALAR